MAKDQIYSSVIRLNTEDAQNKMEDLKKKVQDLVALRDTIDKKKDSGYYKSVSQQITKAKAELKVYENEVMKTIQTLDNLGNASAKDIRDAQKALQKMIDAKPQGAEEMGDFVRRLQEVKQELQSIATMRAFDEVKAGITGTGKSAHQLGAEMRFLRETSDNIGSASVQQLEKALEVAREHLKVAKQGSQAYERSTEYIRVFSGQLEAIKEKQKQSNTLIDRYNKEMREAGKESKVVADETQLIERTMKNISGASVRDLEYSIKALNEVMKDADRSSDGYKEAEKKVRLLRTELERTRLETGAQLSAWGKFTKFLNDSWGGLTLLIGSLTGLSMTIRKTVEDYAKMEEAMADTRKYTGLSDKAIKDLNEDLKKMDTRTSREELNELAGAAGRLGKTSKQDILDFVEAGNKIKVALGDDLGKGAIDQVGKLAMAFGEDENMGLKGAMLATGSALNELAQNSSAQAGFLVDFTARVAGFGKQLGLTQAQIMGFGAVMDENLLRDEMAATAFGNMLTKMQTDTEKFAKIAGMDLKAFTDLLNNDANQAILTLADSLKKADPQNMMKMLDDMGLDGSRAVGVLSTMADKIDDVRERQELATRAYKQGTSVSKEYDTMNNTVEAGIEKCKKQFHEMTGELGERLVPVVKYTISSTALLVKGMKAVVDFVSNHKILIAALAVEIAALNAKRLYGITISKLEVFWNGKVVTSIKAIGTAIKANPWGLAITAVTAFIALLAEAASKTKKNAEEMTALGRAHKKAADDFDNERTKVEVLTRQVHDNNLSYETRKEKLDELKEIVPDYLADLDKEKGLINDNTEALTDYLTQLEKSIKMKAAQEELEEAYRKKRKLKKQESQLNTDLSEANFSLAAAQFSAGQEANRLGTSGMRNLSRGLDIGTKNAQARVNNVKEQLDDVHEQLGQTEKDITELNDEITSTSVELSALRRKKRTDDGESSSPTYESEADRKKREREQRKTDAERRRREAEERRDLREQDKQLKAATEQRLAEEAVSYSLGLTNYREYLKKRQKIQLEGIRQRKEIFKEGSAEYLRLDAEEKQLLAHGDKEQQKLTLAEYEQMHKDLVFQLEKDFNTEGSSIYHNEAALREALFQEEIDYLENRKSLTRKGSLEEMQIEWEMEELNNEHKEQTRLELQERLQKIRTDYLHEANDVQRDIELNALKELYDKKLLTEDEYQRARLAIQAKYATDPAQKNRDKFNENVSNGLSVAREQAGDANAGNPWTGDLTNYMNTNEQLKQLYEQDKLTHSEYLAAKAQNLSEFIEQVQQKYQVMFQSVTAVLSGISNYAKASSDYEVAMVEKKYDKQIEAAGKNQKKVKRLEEKKQKEINAIKSKANKRAMKIEIAQALASTAMGAINAYTSAALVPFIGYILAPIAAAAAVAAGMLQVATIKKQHQTQEAGYYEGGFTGGRQYRKEAGIVHEGEFVANHQAVQNPNVLPFLNFLDQAQKNNTVGSLTAQDVSRQLGTGNTAVVTPIINVQTDNEQLNGTLAKANNSIDRLSDILEDGIPAYCDTERTYKELKKLEQMIKNA